MTGSWAIYEMIFCIFSLTASRLSAAAFSLKNQWHIPLSYCKLANVIVLVRGLKNWAGDQFHSPRWLEKSSWVRWQRKLYKNISLGLSWEVPETAIRNSSVSTLMCWCTDAPEERKSKSAIWNYTSKVAFLLVLYGEWVCNIHLWWSLQAVITDGILPLRTMLFPITSYFINAQSTMASLCLASWHGASDQRFALY